MTPLDAPATFAILALYYLVLGALAAYGFHRLTLVARYLRHRRPPAAPRDPREWPVVTVQLPVYNERYVAPRLLDAVCRLDYPPDRLEIQVLDDSTDDTRELLAERVRHWRRRGLDVRHLHRDDRTGYKAGALAEGLKAARGELVAVFDADFVPPEDFLRRMVPHFSAPDVAMVQARWDHLNPDYSRLTRAQAVLLDGHFAIEHTARHRCGQFFNFNGTAGIWRRRAIEEAGGWSHDTVTEDLDLSYRAQLAGWRFVYVPEVTVPAELPVDVHAFKRQQHRWAKGSVQTARKLLRRVLCARIPLSTKLEAAVHLTNNAGYLLMILLSLLLFPAMLLRRHVDPRLVLAVDAPLFFGATLSVLGFYLAGQWAATGSPRGAGSKLLAALGLGVGLSVNNGRAVLEGLFRDGGVFERTPKYRIDGGGGGWQGKRYRASRHDAVFVEGLLALYMLGCTVTACVLGMWWALPFLYLFLQGYTYVFLLSIVGDRFLPASWTGRRQGAGA